MSPAEGPGWANIFPTTKLKESRKFPITGPSVRTNIGGHRDIWPAPQPSNGLSSFSSKFQEYLEWAEEKSPRDNNKLSHCASIVLTNSHMSRVQSVRRTGEIHWWDTLVRYRGQGCAFEFRWSQVLCTLHPWQLNKISFHLTAFSGHWTVNDWDLNGDQIQQWPGSPSLQIKNTRC